MVRSTFPVRLFHPLHSSRVSGAFQDSLLACLLDFGQAGLTGKLIPAFPTHNATGSLRLPDTRIPTASDTGFRQSQHLRGPKALLMNSFNNIWRAVDPSSSEIQAAQAVFEGLDVRDILPRLVMVRRAVAASFYTDDVPGLAHSDMEPYTWLMQPSSAAA